MTRADSRGHARAAGQQDADQLSERDADPTDPAVGVAILADGSLRLSERRRLDVQDAVTVMVLPDDTPLLEAFATVTRSYDGYHSDDRPEWVSCDDPAVASVLARHYDADVRELAEFEDGDAG